MSQRLGQPYNRYDKQSYEGYNSDYYNSYKIDKNAPKSNDSNYQPLSVSNEKDIKYIERTDYIVINSVDRNITYYPQPNHYVVNLPYEFRNISTIEVVNGVIPDQNNVIQEPYLLLKIDELDGVMASNNTAIANSFAMLHMAAPISPGNFINVDKKTFEHAVLTFKTPKSSLSKLTVSITDWQGNLFNFGDDSAGPNKALQNMFVLKVVTLEKNRDVLNTRNVF